MQHCKENGLLNPIGDAYSFLFGEKNLTLLEVENLAKELKNSSDKYDGEDIYCNGRGSKNIRNFASEFSISAVNSFNDKNFILTIDGSYSNLLQGSSCAYILETDLKLSIPSKFKSIDYVDLILSEVYKSRPTAYTLTVSAEYLGKLDLCLKLENYLIKETKLSAYCGDFFEIDTVIVSLPSNADSMPLIICEILIHSENLAFDAPVYHSFANETYGANDDNMSTYDLVSSLKIGPTLKDGKICFNLQKIYYVFSVTFYSHDPGIFKFNIFPLSSHFSIHF